MPAGVPGDAAEAARDTLGGAAAVGESLPAGLGPAPRRRLVAFIAGFQTAALTGAIAHRRRRALRARAPPRRAAGRRARLSCYHPRDADPRHRQLGPPRRGADARAAADGHEVVGLDVLPSPYTTLVGSVADRALVARAMRGRRRRRARRDAAQAPRRLARRARRSSTPTSAARSRCSRRPSPPASAASSSRARRARSAARSPRRPAPPRRGSPRTWSRSRATSTA